MQNDEDLQAGFKAMAAEDAAAAPRFSTAVSGSQLPRHRSSSRRFAALAASLTGALITLGVGLVWGTNTGFASGRVEGERQREIIAATARGATSQLAALRFEVARTRTQLSHVATGGASATPQAIESELRAIEASISRIEGDLSPNAGINPRSSSTSSEAGPMKRALAMTCTAL